MSLKTNLLWIYEGKVLQSENSLDDGDPHAHARSVTSAK